MQPVKIATWSEVADRSPVGALVDGVDPVIVRFADNHSVLYGRCLHRGAHMADGDVDGDNLICGLHGWDYVFHTGVSSYCRAAREVLVLGRRRRTDGGCGGGPGADQGEPAALQLRGIPGQLPGSAR